MKLQQSFKNGCCQLYIIPTPIGNLGDMTYRSVKILAEDIDILLCEDTRVTKKVLSYYDIDIKVMSYHEYNKEISLPKVEKLLEEGKVLGLVSDAGMPGISDPGFELIRMCEEKDIKCTVLPGSSAFLLGVVRSNFDNSEFMYSGFLHGSKAERNKKLISIMNRDCPTVIYESTHKILKTLAEIESIDENRLICVGRELTKINEEYVKGTASELIEFYNTSVSKGEFIVVIDKKNEDSSSISIEEEYKLLFEQGLTKKEIIKTIAKNRKMSKNEVYMMFIEE